MKSILCIVLPVTLFAAFSHAGLVHRWSFNDPAGAAPAGTVIVDSISGSNGVVVGTGATFNGSALTLPGMTSGNLAPTSISAYVDLPNGLISSKTNLTIEIWATLGSAKNWQRLFDFGRMNLASGMGTGAVAGEIRPDAGSAPGGTSSTDNLMLAVNRGTSANTQRLSGRANGASELLVDSGATINNGVQYHFAIVVEDGAGSFGTSGAQVRWYLNGTLVQTLNLNFKLQNIRDVNNWIGRSQFTGDSQANLICDEFRIYDHAMTPAEIASSRTVGSDPSAPVTQNDSIVMHHNQKALIPVLANDSGQTLANTVSILTPPSFGMATADASGQILYTHTDGAPESDSFTYQVGGVGGTSGPATVTVQFTNALRIANGSLNVPSAPPPTVYELQEAFPSISFNQPLCLRTPPGETNRLFICQKGGLLRVITNLANASSASTFLNLPTLLNGRGEALSTSSEQGLLGLAFHPGYATNRFFFIYYSVNSSGVTYERLSRFMTREDNPNLADTSSEVILFQQADTAGNHNGGDLHFGPDGYLYISLGDGGDQNDSQGHAQKINDGFFAAIARIDVDRRPENLEPNPFSGVPLYSGFAAYKVPTDNPYVGATNFLGTTVNPNTVRTELYAVGFRNPWRFSFDMVTSNLWCGDVGQGLWEEVNIVTNGGNYGWAFREGTGIGPRSGSAPANFNTLYHSPPIYVYGHGSGPNEGNSITGGFVYRGSRIPDLSGAYVFADYVSGNIWALRQTNSSVSVTRIAGQANIVGFAPDPSNGDVLMADIGGGRIFRLVVGTPAGSYPLNLSETGLFADLTDLSPAPGVLPYEPNLSFWSDHALKRRWFTIPDAVSQMTWSREGLWNFPTNQIWVKHFDLEMERGNPETKRRVETRLLVRNAAGVYGVSYQWNENQTDATLAPDAGVDIPFVITNASQTVTQLWRIPSRAECLACHTPQAGYALSFTTRQLNRTNTINGFHGNQLELLHAAGYFANEPEPSNVLPKHFTPDDESVSLELRARSYLDVNCANCHRPGGTGGDSWDGRASTPLFDTRMINGDAINNGGDSANKLIVPGDTLHSIILNRVAATNGFTRMPPIATRELDEAAIELLSRWITEFDANRISFSDWQVANFGSTNAPNGLAEDDPDEDGRNNYTEYLLGTLPLSLNTNIDLSIQVTPENVVQVGFAPSVNAMGQVLVSTNLFDWVLWDVPGNSGWNGAFGPQLLTGPVTNGVNFFRLWLKEY